MNTVYNTI